jgi:transcriptional regulator with XRE-family HTH domain
MMSHFEQDYLVCYHVERLRALRVQSGLDCSDIAKALHISVKRVIRWETSPMPNITIKQFAEYAIACGYMPRMLI